MTLFELWFSQGICPVESHSFWFWWNCVTWNWTYFFFVSGEAIDYLIKNTFTESAGARVGFPKVAIIITDGKSQDEVEIPARELRSIGVEVFSLGRSSLVKYFHFRTTLILNGQEDEGLIPQRRILSQGRKAVFTAFDSVVLIQIIFE